MAAGACGGANSDVSSWCSALGFLWDAGWGMAHFECTARGQGAAESAPPRGGWWWLHGEPRGAYLAKGRKPLFLTHFDRIVGPKGSRGSLGSNTADFS